MFKRSFLLVTVAVMVVLTGCATSSQPVSLADTVAAQPQLSTFNTLLVKSGVADSLKGAQPVTVFAPTNDAFAKVPAKTMAALSSDPVKLKAVLTYHLVAGKIMSADVKNSNRKTLNGADVAFAKAGDFVTVEDAMVQTPDISASNGVVHMVDSVLMPPAAHH